MKHPIVKGHPLHAMLTDLPIASFVLSYGCDILSLVSDEKDLFRDVATVNCVASVVSGALADGVGWWDFLGIPNDHPARQPALIHGLANTSLLALNGVNAAVRLRQRRQGGTSPAPFALSTVALGGLMAAAWIGGRLVFDLGWRVKPAEQLELMEAELHKDGRDDYQERAKKVVEEFERSSALLA